MPPVPCSRWENETLRKLERESDKKQPCHRVLTLHPGDLGYHFLLPPKTVELGLSSSTLAGGLHFELAVVKIKNSCESRICARVSARDTGGNTDEDV